MLTSLTGLPIVEMNLDGAVRWVVPISIQNEWQNLAPRYFELVLTGDDTEKFWRDLLAYVRYNARTKEVGS